MTWHGRFRNDLAKDLNTSVTSMNPEEFRG